MWILTTSALLVGLPLALSLEDEAKLVAQEREVEGQREGQAVRNGLNARKLSAADSLSEHLSDARKSFILSFSYAIGWPEWPYTSRILNRIRRRHTYASLPYYRYSIPTISTSIRRLFLYAWTRCTPPYHNIIHALSRLTSFAREMLMNLSAQIVGAHPFQASDGSSRIILY